MNRLIATIILQDLDERKKYYRTIGREQIDVTNDVLALGVDDIRNMIGEFDHDGAPYLENLPGDAAQTLSKKHGGPTEVYLSIGQFFQSLGLLPTNANPFDWRGQWLTDDILNQARDLIAESSKSANAINT